MKIYKKNAVAFDVISYFHLIGCMNIASAEKCDKLTVHVSKNMNGQYAIPESKFNYEGCDVIIKYQESFSFSIVSFVFLILKNFFFFCSFFLFLFKSKKTLLLHHSYYKPTGLRYFKFLDCFDVKAFSFEEGVGTYGNLRHHLDVAKRESKRFPVISYFIKKTLSFFSVGRGFMRGEGVDEERFINICCFLSLNFFHDSKISFGVNERVVLIVGAPWLKLLGFAEDDVKSLLKKAISYYVDFDVYIKPHPLDDFNGYEELGLKVIDNDIPMEIVLTAIKPYFILSGHSTALVMAEKFWGYKEDFLAPSFLNVLKMKLYS